MAALHLNFGLDSFTPAQGALALQAASLHLWWKTSCPPKHPADHPLQRGGSAAGGTLWTSPSIFYKLAPGRGKHFWQGARGVTFPFLTSASCLSPASGAAGRRELPWAKQRSREAGERQGRRRDPSWGAGGGQGQGRGTRRGVGATRKGSKAGRICGGEGKKGQIEVAKRRKGSTRNREIGVRNRCEKSVQEIELKKKGQNWLLQALRDAKTNGNVRKVKNSSYKCLGCSDLTHKVPMASPRDREQPPLYPMNHNSYPPLRGQVSPGRS